MNAITIGYWGVPGTIGGRTHVVRNGKNLCGDRIHAKAEFQWCADFQTESMYIVQCQRCKDRAKKLFQLASNKKG